MVLLLEHHVSHVHNPGQVELLLTLEEYCEEERDHTAHGHCFEAVFQQVRCCHHMGYLLVAPHLIKQISQMLSAMHHHVHTLC